MKIVKITKRIWDERIPDRDAFVSKEEKKWEIIESDSLPDDRVEAGVRSTYSVRYYHLDEMKGNIVL